MEVTNAEFMSLLSRSCTGICNYDILNNKEFEMRVDFTEDFTNINVSASAEFEIRKNEITIKFAENNPTTYKAGLPYNGYVSRIIILVR